jgi:squalene cyclase
LRAASPASAPRPLRRPRGRCSRCSLRASAQRADGDWDEAHFTGTGFPGDFYIRYHLYRLSYPLMALGRFLRAPEPAPRS